MLDHTATGHGPATPEPAHGLGAPTRRTLLRGTAGLVVSFALARGVASAQPMPAGHVETPAGTAAAPGAAAGGVYGEPSGLNRSTVMPLRASASTLATPSWMIC